ncbi:hypothetical protein RYH73_15395 [Olivibacter sp. CPCC 100613]|uniref:hypothetical protein n=1 Tax=Olivibacter sp. CPCC 100613 TaxID=3079931 RepID=UPI002FFD11B6
MQTKEPFDITLNHIDYAIFPEEEDIYTVYKDGIEYMKVMKDTANSWIKLDPETELPRFEADDEINAIGKEIIAYEAQS